MAQRRMFSLKIVDSDIFLDMPKSAQCLYFHLCMRADDDGFIGNPKKIMRMTNSGDDDIKILFSKQFVIAFESGICVIKHWKIHNYIKSDRYHETMYIKEKSELLEDSNGIYTKELGEVDTKCIQNVPKMEPEVRLGKVRLGKSKYREFVFLSDDEFKKLVEKLGKEETDKYIESLNNYIGSKGKKYKSHYHTILTWYGNDKKKKAKSSDVIRPFKSIFEEGPVD